MSANPFTKQGIRNLDLVGRPPKAVRQAACSHPAEFIGTEPGGSGNVICKRCRRDFGPPPANPHAD